MSNNIISYTGKFSRRVNQIIFVITILGCLFINCLGEEHGENNIEGDKNWNELKFTQEWGYSECLQFKSHSGGKGVCNYEGKPSIWTIHGIWPSKTGTMGPNFCEKVNFDPSSIKDLVNDMNIFWYEINKDKDPNSFWGHEWLKHGSCAMQLEVFNTEYKYFKKALLMRQDYDLYSMLKNGGVVPHDSTGTGYLYHEFEDAIEKALKVDSIITCYSHKDNNNNHEFHILSVEICFDRELNPMNCSAHPTLENRAGSGNCPPNSKILYLDNFTKKSEL